MRRQAIILGTIIAFTASLMADRIPTDMERLNRFASAYNTYVEHLRAGRVDLKAWDKVRYAWRELAN